MTYAGHDFMPLNRQLFQRSIAEALAELLAQKYATAKQLARSVGIDPSTAENLRKGHLSVTTLEKIISAEGRGLWERLSEEIFGETALQHEERRLEAIIQKAEHARGNITRIRAEARAVLSRTAGVDPTGPGQLADLDSGDESRSWAPIDQRGSGKASRSRSGGAR